MATMTATVGVNAAFLQEIKDDNLHLRELFGRLSELTKSPFIARNHANQCVQLLSELRDQIAMHFVLEEAYGYFEDAIDAAPRLAERAEELRDQHRRLFERIRDIAEEGEELLANRSLQRRVFALTHQFQEFQTEFYRHESEENALILEALEDDIGVGD